MNYLPMLSHQQLLYLLTMSFVSRVPRSLLPGVRSSRLRDHLKEERELLVKKAFSEDMLHQNKLLSVLLGRQSKYHAVLWHPDSLPCMGKDSELLNQMETISTIQQEEAFKSDPGNNSDHNGLLDEMKIYMEQLNGLYLNDVDDDISCDFQVNSGTLACVACGILAYPFLAVVQPCGRASMDILPCSDISCHGEGDSYHINSHLPNGECCVNTISEGHAAVLLPRDSPLFDQGWNTSVKFLRPRVFCLEHAVQIEDVLKNKGGVHVMVICHSDYQKIKAHASVVAEEIGYPFNCKDHTLNPASQEDLILINLAIDDEDDYGEDWTTKLGFNLRYCVKVRKTSTFKQEVQHALPLDGLFHYKSCTNFDMKWKSTRHRSKVKLHYSRNFEHCTSVDLKTNPESSRTDGGISKKEQKLIQYSRRKKAKPSDSTGASKGQGHRKNQSRTIEESRNEVLFDHHRNASNKVGSPELGKSRSDCHAEGVTDLKGEVQVIETSRFACSNSSPSRAAVLTASDTLLVEDLEKITSISHDDEAVSKRRSAFPLKVYDNLENVHATDGFSSNLSLGYSARRNSMEQVLSSITAVDQSGFCTDRENPEVMNEFGTVTSDDEVQRTETQARSEIQDVLSCSTVLKGVDSLSTVQREGCSEVARNFCSKEVHNDVAFFVETTPIYQIKGMGEDEMICDSDLKMVEGPTSPLWEASSAVPKDSVPEQKLSASATGDNGVSVREVNEESSSLCVDGDSMREVNEESSSRCVDLPTTVSVEEYHRIPLEITNNLNRNDLSDSSPLQHELPKGLNSSMTSCPYMKNGRKRMRQGEQEVEQKINGGWFIRSPCEGLRSRVQREGANKADISRTAEEKSLKSDIKPNSVSSQTKKAVRKRPHRCDIDSCRMSFRTKEELRLHKRNRCPLEDCGKKFSSHKYAVLHQRVHDDDRPLKCPWEGCTMSFKWAWARTEHIRLHTGERPYKCQVEGCGLSFRFVSDFSRHRRKMGHYVNLQPGSSHLS